jgi:DNA polymerase-1
MKTPWLLLDCNYLAWRAFHSMGSLSFKEIQTGVVYGVLREVLSLQETFGTRRIAFCFDRGMLLRKIDYPGYKARRTKDKRDEEDHKEVRKQVNLLRTKYLPLIGFRNLFSQSGYEADDVIAGIVEPRPTKNFIVVSSDKDLYQLLSPRVTIWNPHKKERITEGKLREEFGIGPSQWADVKAIAGCVSDEVEGVRGIGEKTAAKFLRGELQTGKQFDLIVKGNSIWRRNLGIVRLPYPGLRDFQLVKDEVTGEGWQAIIDLLGMRSLAAYCDLIPRR